MTAHSFNNLLHKIQRGYPSALEPIYRAFYPSMCGQALGIVRNKQDAEDVASEALLKLIKYARGDFADVKDCGAFMYTLVRNTALDNRNSFAYLFPPGQYEISRVYVRV